MRIEKQRTGVVAVENILKQHTPKTYPVGVLAKGALKFEERQGVNPYVQEAISTILCGSSVYKDLAPVAALDMAMVNRWRTKYRQAHSRPDTLSQRYLTTTVQFLDSVMTDMVMLIEQQKLQQLDNWSMPPEIPADGVADALGPIVARIKPGSVPASKVALPSLPDLF